MKNIHIVTIVIALLLASCNKVLDQFPISNPTTETYYKTAADAEAATTGAYTILQGIYRDENIVTPNIIAADDGIPFLTGNADRVAMWRYNIVPANTFVNNIYSQAYIGIQRCNVAIDRIPAISMNETLKKRYIAEAKFVRALLYFNLVRFFGGVPLSITETNSLGEANIPRASEEEIYNQIEADLKEAEEVLPLQMTGTNAGRATQGAAKGLLAKVYLTRAGNNAGSPFWARAAAKAKEVIDLGIYGLFDDYADAFRIATRGGRETIFEIRYITDLLGNNFTTGYAPRGAPIVPNNGSGILRVSKDLFDRYTTGDRRRNVTFLTSFVSGGQTIQLSVENTDPARAVAFNKLTDPSSRVGGQGGTSFPYMRYAEILLTYAEALNEANNAPNTEAYNALNQIRNRAGLAPLTNLNKASFKEAILLERRLELAFEGHRWFDLARTGNLVNAVKSENSFGRNATIQSFNIKFPIPQREMDANPSLKQNEGY
jgi:hypothetical protein